MRLSWSPIVLINFLLLKTIFSYNSEEIEMKLEAMGIKRKQLNFLQEPYIYDEFQDRNLSFEEIVIRKGYS